MPQVRMALEETGATACTSGDRGLALWTATRSTSTPQATETAKLKVGGVADGTTGAPATEHWRTYCFSTRLASVVVVVGQIDIPLLLVAS